MHHLARRHAAVVDARVGLLEDDDAAALDPRVVGVDRGGREVGEAHVGDEPGALLHLEQRLPALRPLGDADLAAEQAGLDADVGQRLGQAEGAAPDLAVSRPAGAARSGSCSGRAAPACPVRGWARGRGCRPGCRWRRRRRPRTSSRATRDSARFFGPSMKPPCCGIHEAGGDAGLVEGLEQLGLLRRSIRGCCARRCATRRATSPRATRARTGRSIWRSYRSWKRHMIWRTSSPGRVLRVSRGLGAAVVSMEAGSVDAAGAGGGELFASEADQKPSVAWRSPEGDILARLRRRCIRLLEAANGDLIPVFRCRR